MNSKLKTARINCGFTQLEMSVKSNITERTYQRYEAGKRTPKIKIALKIAEILKTDVNKIFTE